MKRVIESVVGEGRIEIFFEYKKLRSWLNLLIELVVMIVVFIIFLFLCYEHNIVTSSEKFKVHHKFFSFFSSFSFNWVAILAGTGRVGRKTLKQRTCSCVSPSPSV